MSEFRDSKYVSPDDAKHTTSEKAGEVLKPTESIDQAQIIELEENRNGQFHRSFTPRQVHVC